MLKLFGPGSGSDILARLLPQYLQIELNTPIVAGGHTGDRSSLQKLTRSHDRPCSRTFRLYVQQLGIGASFIDSGRLRAIGIMADERSPVLPGMPAVGETYPGFDFVNWGAEISLE